MDPPVIICPSIEELSIVDQNYVCEEKNCKRIFKSTSNLRMHLVKHHGRGALAVYDSDNIRWVCPVENCIYNQNSVNYKWFVERRLLKQHYVKVHYEKRHLCTKCTGSFATLAMYKRHLTTCGAKFVCGICDWKYDSNEALMVHLRRKHPEAHRNYIDSRKLDKIRARKNKVGKDITSSIFSQIEFIDNTASGAAGISYNINVLNVENSDISNEYKLSNDTFTQTAMKIAKKPLNKTKIAHAATQTSRLDKRLSKQAKGVDKSTSVAYYCKILRTFGTQTADEQSTLCKTESPIIVCYEGNQFEKLEDVSQPSTSLCKSENPFLSCFEEKQCNTLGEDLQPGKSFCKSENESLVYCGNGENSLECNNGNLSEIASKSFESSNLYIDTHVNMETQTALDELVYSNCSSTNVLDNSSIFPELTFISDIQTQTWPSCSGVFDPNQPSTSTANLFPDTLYNGNDQDVHPISTKTQTCQFPDFEEGNCSYGVCSTYFKDKYLCDPGNLSEEFLIKNNVLKEDIFLSCETQTCFQDFLGDDSDENKNTDQTS